MVALANQRVRVYRLYLSGELGTAQRMQICVNEQLVIEDYDIRSIRGPFEINVWPMKFALFEATGGEMIRVPQEEARLEMPAPSYFTWD